MVLFGKRSFNKGRNDLKLVTYYIPQVLFNKKKLQLLFLYQNSYISKNQLTLPLYLEYRVTERSESKAKVTKQMKNMIALFCI